MSRSKYPPALHAREAESDESGKPLDGEASAPWAPLPSSSSPTTSPCQKKFPGEGGLTMLGHRAVGGASSCTGADWLLAWDTGTGKLAQLLPVPAIGARRGSLRGCHPPSAPRLTPLTSKSDEFIQCSRSGYADPPGRRRTSWDAAQGWIRENDARSVSANGRVGCALGGPRLHDGETTAAPVPVL